jgi:DNA topoisomerase-1
MEHKGKIIIIVESPGKIKKIQSIVGPKYEVLSSVGHIIDLDPTKSVKDVIDIENGFTPSYVPTRQSQKNVIKNLKERAKNASGVLLAADEDREGEMIAWSIAHVLKLKNPQRIVFNSITKSEILKAIKSPIGLDYNLINAQKTRRIMDRIVGYEISPLLWRNIGKGKLSAGRVQSVVVEIIIDKETEINDFMNKDSKSFYRFKGTFSYKNKQFNTSLHELQSIDKNGIYKGGITKIHNKKKSMDFLEKCKSALFTVICVFDKPSCRLLMNKLLLQGMWYSSCCCQCQSDVSQARHNT